jgi:hypothetical protein
MDPDSDPDPAIFVIRPSRRKQKTKLTKIFICLLLFEGTFTSFFKDKNQKREQNSRNQGFSYYFA